MGWKRVLEKGREAKANLLPKKTLREGALIT